MGIKRMTLLRSANFIILSILFGCESTEEKDNHLNYNKVEPSFLPVAVSCIACNKKVSKSTTKCSQCGHPTNVSLEHFKESVFKGKKKISEGFPYYGKVHLLKEGESITEVANRYGSKVEWILESNLIDDPSSIEVGVELFVPVKDLLVD
jgi:hypothetical protein